MGALDGKIALVTGAGRGLGRASAQVFAREGAKVVVVSLHQETGEETVRLIKDAGGEATFVAADVSNSKDVQFMVQATLDIYGGLDCAVNNAAINVGIRPLAEISDEDWHRSIAVNLTGVFFCMKAEIPIMLERGGGVIVNISSAGGVVGMAGATPYAAAKHGILGMTKVAALDYGARGIRVNAICPGAMWTPMLREVADKNPQHVEKMMNKHPIGRFAEPAEVAETVVWLCTSAASFVLGHAFSVDGGYVIQ